MTDTPLPFIFTGDEFVSVTSKARKNSVDMEFRVTDAAGCSNSAYFTVSYFVGINELGETNLVVYPNPAKDIIHVDGSEVATRIDLIDMTGKTVYSDTPNSAKFQFGVTTYAEGVYFLNLYTEKGLTTMRVVINR